MQKKKNYQLVTFYTAARPASSPSPVAEPSLFLRYTDRYAELKAFGAAALAGGAEGFHTVQGNYYGGNNLQHTPENAGLQGASRCADPLALGDSFLIVNFAEHALALERARKVD